KMENNLYLAAAVAIGDQLVRESRNGSDGIYWETYDIEDGLAFKVYDTDIYSGSAGIILFLIELYNITGTSTYLDCIRSASWELKEKTEKETGRNFSFFCGNSGIAYTLIRAGNLLNEPALVEAGLILLGKYEVPAGGNVGNCDMLAGVAGCVQGLLYVYDLTGRDSLVPLITGSLCYLLEHMHVYREGVYWNRNGYQIKGLCGMAHGSSGVGTVLVQAGEYFKSPLLTRIGLMALRYEDIHFDTVNNNWPDFRLGIYGQSDYLHHKEKILQGDLTFFNNCHSDMVAWCHGASGCLLSRLQIADNTGDLQHISTREAIDAMGRLNSSAAEANLNSSFTICHGQGGNALVYYTSFEVTGKKEFLNKSVAIANLSLQGRDAKGYYHSGFYLESVEDLSFFNGIAGIGYLYLLLVNGKEMKNIFHYKLERDHRRYAVISDETLFNSILRGSFPEAYQQLSPNPIGELTWADLRSLPDKTGIIKYLLERQGNNSREELNGFKNVLRRDLSLLYHNNNIKSFSFVNAYNKFIQEQAASTLESFLQTENISLVVNPCVHLHFQGNDAGNGPENVPQENTTYLVIEKPDGCRQQFLNGLAAGALELFRTPADFSSALERFCLELDNSPETQALAGELLQQQIAEFIKSGIIILSDNKLAN
ncbi:lanthionine synthetase LanC family protein, partial [Chitinophaga sp.]|uniref:lanthionine synthetase LanC family protein n=1 Tax=Chitinophaga sp. TaxID=1869181 RepID=UPI002F95DA70